MITEQLRDNASKRCKCGFSNLARGAARRDGGLFGLGLPQQARETFPEGFATVLLPNLVGRTGIRRDEVTPLRLIMPIIQYFIIQAGTEQYGGNRIWSAVLSIKPRTDECLVVTRVKFTGQRWPQPSMSGPFRPVYLDVKGEQSVEQLGLAIKMMLAEPSARSLFAAVFE
jgi:hypothetical protein